MFGYPDETLSLVFDTLHENARNLSERLITTLSYSVVKIARLDGLSLNFFNWKQAQQKVNHCSQRIKKKEKRKNKIKKCNTFLPKQLQVRSQWVKQIVTSQGREHRFDANRFEKLIDKFTQPMVCYT